MFRIGEFSKLSFISVRMLRHYHDMGLLTPAHTDQATGYRYYTAAQLTTAGRIQSLKEMGFSLAVIGELLQGGDDPELLRRHLWQRRFQLEEELGRMNGQLSRLDSALQRIGKEASMMNYTVIVKELPARQVASLRRVIPSYDREGELWAALYQEISGQNVRFAEPCYSIARFHDEGFQEENVDVEIETAVTGEYQDTAQVRFHQVPAQLVASVTFKGGYDQVREVCAAAANWISDNSYRMCAPMFNIYIVSPGMDPNPENWVTDVCFPIEKAQ